MVDSSPTEQSPAVLRKHMALVRDKWNAEVIYVRPQVTAYNRKRLIEHKVPFVVPGNQMYLPMLGIDLREHFRRLRSQPPTFSPSTQAVVIFALLRGTAEGLTPKAMADRLGYTAMTMTRAFDELEAASLGEITVSGKERRLRFVEGPKEIWTKAQPFMRSPVEKRLWIHRMKSAPRGVRAGLSALAHYSMLAPPAHDVHALSREDWKTLRERQKVIEVPEQDPDVQEIEVWAYTPTLLAEGNVVDRLSLYLSLKDNRDERVEASLEEMIRSLKW
jgi:hypothetical protein